MTTSPGEALVGVVAVATLPVGILAALFLGPLEGATVFVVGWLLLVPILGILTDAVSGPGVDDEIEGAVKERIAESIEGSSDGASARGSGEDPLEALRERYARGEIGDAEFERTLERLIATEDVEVPDGVSVGDVAVEREGETDDDVAFER